MERVTINKFEDYYVNGDIRFKAEIIHKDLGEYKVLSDRDEDILDNKIENLLSKWSKKWSIVSAKQQKLQLIQDNKEKAKYLTEEAQTKIFAIQNTLKYTLDIDDTIDWNSLKSFDRFKLKRPQPPNEETINPPNKKEPKYQPIFDFWDNFLSKRKAAKIQLCKDLYRRDFAEYERRRDALEKAFSRIYTQYEKQLADWKLEKEDFYHDQKIRNGKVDLLKENYFTLDKDSIIAYCDLVLTNSDYPKEFPQSYDLEYIELNKILIVEYWLPEPSAIPNIKEVKYIATRNELKEYFLSESQRNKMYDKLIYEIALRTIHELFEADAADAIDMITFNGRVNYINQATGKKENSCIVSLQVDKEEFLEIDLGLVDPKICFKALKGVGSSKLYGITPVKPIIYINKNDSRITDHYDVADKLDEEVNLAAMNWEDFEHLVRELFEKEFETNGGEVKVTRASRDGGVDAIAFDPDPIRGGKIVIQAKRYTNTVGVSAIRDLYGTVLNEGANKGIIVTTADYGPDAYNFAKEKPLTLLNGANLLHLLSKHGHKAKIDLKEAKENK